MEDTCLISTENDFTINTVSTSNCGFKPKKLNRLNNLLYNNYNLYDF